MIEFALLIAGILVLVNSRLWSNGYWRLNEKYGQLFNSKKN